MSQDSCSPCPAILDYKVKSITGKEVSLCEYSGKVILAVNTASNCGFTSQYEGLQKIYEEYKDRGLVILGFPSNEFGSQEPGGEEEIQTFCQKNYGVTFPMFAKTKVKAKGDNPFFKELIRQSKTHPRWNFYKYLINQEGKVVTSFSSLTKPQSKKVRSAIESLILSS